MAGAMTGGPGAADPHSLRSGGERDMMVGGSVITADTQLLTGSGRLLFWNAHEPTGTAAGVVTLYDGNNAGGQTITTIALGSGATDTEPLTVKGLPVKRGIFVHVVTGEVILTVNFEYDDHLGGS